MNGKMSETKGKFKCVECKARGIEKEATLTLTLNDKQFPLCVYHFNIISGLLREKGIRYYKDEIRNG